jgi:mono/diheme cytochrome c family protein
VRLPSVPGRVEGRVYWSSTTIAGDVTAMTSRLARPASGQPSRALSWLIALLAALAMAGLVLGLVLGWRITAPRPAFSEADAAGLERGGDADRGKSVFDIGGCASCHASPGQPDRLRLGGGLALASPFGTFFPPNISPDPTDGIGRWRAIDLANALMAGISPDGQHLYPALPYTSYAHMRVEDIKDLMAYLRTLTAVSGRAPPHDLSFPFTIRRLVGLWKFLFLDRTAIKPDPTRDATWNRGRYLVDAVGHCAECHSARNMLGAIKASSRFAGGQDQEGVGFVPNITPAGIGHWSSRDIVEALTTGHTPQLRRIGSSMADVVTDTAALPLSDRQAIAAYLQSLPARTSPDAVRER